MSDEKPMVEGFEAPISLRYSFAAGRAASKFLHEIKKGKIVGQRSPVTGFVSVPPRGSCPISGVALEEEVVLGEVGTIMSFTIVHIPMPTNPIKPPFIVANIVLDDSDQTFIHLVSGCSNDDVEIGSRVKAVWKDRSEWDFAMENIAHFQPTGEVIDIEVLKKERLAAVEKFKNA